MKIDVPDEHAAVLLRLSDLMYRRRVIIGQGSFTVDITDTEAMAFAAAMLVPGRRVKNRQGKATAAAKKRRGR